MGIRDWFKKRDETEVKLDDVLLEALMNGEEITREQAMTIPTVSGAVNFITDAVAMIPLKLYKEIDDHVEEVKNDPRVALLNDDTKDTMDGFQFKKAMVEDYLMGKGGYAYIKKRRNEFTAVYYVEDKNVSIMKNSDPIFKSYDIMVGANRYKPFEFIKLLRNTKDGASGTGVTSEVSKALETAYQTLLYQLSSVKTGGNKKGFLKAERRLAQEEIDLLKEAWRKLYANNSENVVVLNNGLDFKESSNSSVELQINESKKTLQDEVNSIFHIEEDYNMTFKKAVAPILSAFEVALNREFLLEKEKGTYYWAFDTREITKQSSKERYEAYKLASECGFMTKNEMRYQENMGSIDGFDVVDVGLGSVLYDINSKTYYTPNTNKEVSFDTLVPENDENAINNEKTEEKEDNEVKGGEMR